MVQETPLITKYLQYNIIQPKNPRVSPLHSAYRYSYLNCRDKGEMLTTIAMKVEGHCFINVSMTQSIVSSENNNRHN
jgi:hypothetical protein